MTEENEKLKQRIRELEEALRPFAEAWEQALTGQTDQPGFVPWVHWSRAGLLLWEPNESKTAETTQTRKVKVVDENGKVIYTFEGITLESGDMLILEETGT